MAKTLLLDQITWDLTIDANGNIAVADEPYAIAQDAASACRLFKGELWYDVNQGVPYWQAILGQMPPLAYLRAQYQKAALSVPDTMSAEIFISSITQDRVVSGQVQVTGTGPQTAAASFGSFLLAPERAVPTVLPREPVIVEIEPTSGPDYSDPDFVALYNSFTLTLPNLQQQGAMFALITSLKQAGVWAKLDVLYVFAALDQQAALLNWKNPRRFNATAVNSPAFAPSRGFTGDGVSSYVVMNFNPSTANGNYQLNSCSMGVWPLSIGHGPQVDPTVSRLFIGDNSGGGSTRSGIAAAASFFEFDLNSVSLPSFSVTAPQFYVVSRSDATNISGYANGVSLGTKSDSTTVLLNSNIGILAEYNGAAFNFSTPQIASAFVGGSLTSAQVSAFYSALQTYLHSVGAV